MSSEMNRGDFDPRSQGVGKHCGVTEDLCGEPMTGSGRADEAGSSTQRRRVRRRLKLKHTVPCCKSRTSRRYASGRHKRIAWCASYSFSADAQPVNAHETAESLPHFGAINPTNDTVGQRIIRIDAVACRSHPFVHVRSG